MIFGLQVPLVSCPLSKLGHIVVHIILSADCQLHSSILLSDFLEEHILSITFLRFKILTKLAASEKGPLGGDIAGYPKPAHQDHYLESKDVSQTEAQFNRQKYQLKMSTSGNLALKFKELITLISIIWYFLVSIVFCVSGYSENPINSNCKVHSVFKITCRRVMGTKISKYNRKPKGS